MGSLDGFSSFPIRFANGEIRLVENDLDVSGFGTNWRHVRTWGNQMTGSNPPYDGSQYDGPNGMNWFSIDFPYLVQPTPNGTNTLTVMGDANSTLWFDVVGASNNYVARFGQMETLVHDVALGVYRLTRLDGSFTEFSNFTAFSGPHGLFQRFVDAAGNQTEESKGVRTR